tara:strand:- start:485 stop:1111 length:627 start_codon:yes stop_codon:yes gene_type:complete
LFALPGGAIHISGFSDAAFTFVYAIRVCSTPLGTLRFDQAVARAAIPIRFVAIVAGFDIAKTRIAADGIRVAIAVLINTVFPVLIGAGVDRGIVVITVFGRSIAIAVSILFSTEGLGILIIAILSRFEPITVLILITRTQLIIPIIAIFGIGHAITVLIDRRRLLCIYFCGCRTRGTPEMQEGQDEQDTRASMHKMTHLDGETTEGDW